MFRASRIVSLSTLLIFWAACGTEAPTGSLPDSGYKEGGDSGIVTPPDGGIEEKGRAEVSETILDFGTVLMGTSATRTLTLTNNGQTPARVSLSEITGPDAARYAVTLFVPQTLEMGQIATVELTLNGSELGQQFANILVFTCDGGCPVSVSLIGNVATTGIECVEAIDLGTVNPGVCATGRVSCTNNGNRQESILSAELDPLSDDVFALNTTMFPINLDPGAAADVEVTFCPDTIGDFFARVFIQESVTEVRGHGGGASLSCSPTTIDFGTVPVGGSATRELICLNLGFEDVVIVNAVISSRDYTTNLGPTIIAANESRSFTVTVAPNAPGVVESTLTITSNDPDSPNLVIDMTTNAIQVGECIAALTPATTELGLVAIGDVRIGVLVLENIGADPCLIDLVDAPAIGGFSFPSLPASGDALDPGETAELAYLFQPGAAGTSSVTVGVTFQNPSSTPVSALIHGTGGDFNLTISPPALDFGSIPFGCALAGERTLTLTNSGNTPVAISSIALVSTTSSGFSLPSPPATPIGLLAFDTLELAVGYAPILNGPVSATLEITVLGQGAPILVPITGSGSASTTRSDSASLTSPSYDILFMVDDSASMGLAQDALAEVIPRFTSRLTASGSDFHFALVTTDMFEPSHMGLFQGTPPVIDRQTPDYANAIAQRVVPGVNGDGTQESGIDAMLAALTPPLSTGPNAGFLRPGSRLVIFVISDEDDQSNAAVVTAAATLRNVAGAGGLSVYAIVGPATGNCNGPQGQTGAAPSWAELVARTNGTAYSYCEPVRNSVDAMIAELFTTGRVELSADPVPETISVTQMGNPVPTTSWYYQRVTNSVILTATASLGNAAIDVAYEVFCLSPTCGDGNLDAHESCDDGNGDDGDNCTAGCRLAICGDGFTALGTETCDDRNLNDTDACISTCAAASCGDGFLQIGVEDCDDGNTTNNDGCPASCEIQTTLAGFYTVSPLTAATYAPLATETLVTLTGGDDNGFGTVAIPFAFDFFGVPITAIDVSPNGLAATSGLDLPSVANASFPDRATPGGILAAWWEDLIIDPAITDGASLAFDLQGTAPDQVLVIQWRNVRLASQNTANHRRFNFQIALFETTNVIEMRYGETATSGAPATATSASTGAENFDGTIGQNLLTCTPNCVGPARPGNPNGFPRASLIRLTP